MLDLWWTELRQVKAHLRALFPHPSVAASAAAFLDGLLGPERRKTGWMRAEAAGDPGPWRQQAVLGRSPGDADALRDLVREDAIETLASPDAGLVIDETGFLKQGRARGGLDGQTPDRRARSPTVRSACWRLMSRTRAAPSSTARLICLRTGRPSQSAVPRLMGRMPFASPLSRREQRR